MKIAAAPAAAWEERAEALGKIGDAVLRADVDFYNVPFSGNVVGNPKANPGVHRFSEYHPKHWKHPKPSIFIPPETYGRAHAEVRPIRGSGESLITRFTLDYRGDEVYSILPKPLRPLAIDCFTALTPPTISYDRAFDKRDKTIKKIGKDGSLRYQNACREKRLATPFLSEAAPPPGSARGREADWMFYFQPLRNTLRNRILERYINRRVGALWLWASNPTYGFTDPKQYERFGIRYNTWPRRLGDLLRFFGPWLEADSRESLRQAAPFLNPNSEYLDGKGLRQKIPEDPAALAALNARRKSAGLPPVPVSRGAPVDWTFSELLNDPHRLAATPADRFPGISARLQFKPGSELALPGVGSLALGASTEVFVDYRLIKVDAPAPGGSRARAELSITLRPLDLGPLDLHLFGFRLRAKSIRAQAITWTLPLEAAFAAEDKKWKLRPDWIRESIRIQGLKAEGLEIQSAKSSFRATLGQARIASLRYGPKEGKIEFSARGIKVQDLHLGGAFGSLLVQAAAVPRLDGKAGRDFRTIEVELPSVVSSGKIRFRPQAFSRTRLDVAPGEILKSFSLRYGPGEDRKVAFEVPRLAFAWAGPNIAMDPGASYLEAARVELSPGEATLSGNFHLAIRELKRLPGTDILRWKKLEVFPHLEDILVSGPAILEASSGRFRLRRNPAAEGKLRASFRLSDTRIRHEPIDEAELRSHPEKSVIQTDLRIDSARIAAEDIRELSYRQSEKSGTVKGRLETLESGPIVIHGIRGGGSIWLPTGLWSWLRGNFPHFGVPESELPEAARRKARRGARPDPEKILEGWPKALRDLLWDAELAGYGNFLRVEGISVAADPAKPEASRTRLDDIRVFAQESGGFGQFGALRIPELMLRQSADADGKTRFEVDAGSGKIFTHIFLKDPKRGYDRFEVKTPSRKFPTR